VRHRELTGATAVVGLEAAHSRHEVGTPELLTQPDRLGRSGVPALGLHPEHRRQRRPVLHVEGRFALGEEVRGCRQVLQGTRDVHDAVVHREDEAEPAADGGGGQVVARPSGMVERGTEVADGAG